MQYLTNPFNYANEEPKIHDNESWTSYGFKHTLTTPLYMPKELTDEVAHIWFLPGAHCAVTVRGVADGTLVPAASANVSNHILWADPLLKPSVYLDDDNMDSVTGLFFDDDKAVRQWRIVSQALKINVLNTADSNDGWFEAIRFAPNYSEIVTADLEDENLRHPSAQYAAVGPVQDIDGLIDKSTIALSQVPTYQTGRLRDLNDLVFMSQRSDLSCPWIGDLDRDFMLTNDDGSHVKALLGQKFYDTNFDGIYIRIHGRKDPPSDANIFCRGTRLLLEVASNHEIVFGQAHPFSRLMSKSTNKQSLVNSILTKIQKYKTPGRTSTSIYKTTNSSTSKKRYGKKKKSRSKRYRSSFY